MKTMVANISEQIDWSDLRIVLAVARSESIKGAAKHLRMTDATISRHISSVEECLGIHLFERMSTGMRITPACRELIEHVSRAESALESGIEAATGHLDKPSGNIRLTTVPTVMNHIIVPAVDNFLMQYPEISLSLVGLPTNLSMMRRETDIALRLSLPKSDLLAISRSIGRISTTRKIVSQTHHGSPTNPICRIYHRRSGYQTILNNPVSRSTDCVVMMQTVLFLR